MTKLSDDNLKLIEQTSALLGFDADALASYALSRLETVRQLAELTTRSGDIAEYRREAFALMAFLLVAENIAELQAVVTAPAPAPEPAPAPAPATLGAIVS